MIMVREWFLICFIAFCYSACTHILFNCFLQWFCEVLPWLKIHLKGERCQAYVEACVILMLKPGKITQEKKIMVSFSYEHAHEDPK